MCTAANESIGSLADRPQARTRATLHMMDGHKDRTRALVFEMLRATGLDLTGLARAAGLAPTTLTRFMNDSSAKHTLSSRTLAKLSEVSGVAANWVPAPPHDPAVVTHVSAGPTPGWGARIAAVRESLDIAPAAFCRRMGWHPNKLADLESERSQPTIRDLAQMRSAWGISSDFVLFEDLSAISPRMMQHMTSAGAAPAASQPLHDLRRRMRSRIEQEELPDIHEAQAPFGNHG